MRKVIFDLDGTLFQTQLTILKAIADTLAEFDWLVISEEEINNNIGKTTEEFIKEVVLDKFLKEGLPFKLLKKVKSNNPLEEIAADKSSEEYGSDKYIIEVTSFMEDLEKFEKCLRTHEREAVRERGKLFGGVREMLEELTQKGYQLYICSNGSEEYIELVLQSTDIRNYFAGVRSSKHSTSKEEAIRQIISDEDFAVVVGDTLIDFEGAKKAQLPSIAVTYGYGNEKDAKEATFIANSPEEIIDYIVHAEATLKDIWIREK